MNRFVRVSMYGLGLAIMVGCMTTQLLASGVPVPEIDGGTIATGVAGLTAAALILKTRRRVK